jgi:hypothetical protein
MNKRNIKIVRIYDSINHKNYLVGDFEISFRLLKGFKENTIWCVDLQGARLDYEEYLKVGNILRGLNSQIKLKDLNTNIV